MAVVSPLSGKILPTPMPVYCCQRTHFCDCCRNMGPVRYGVEGAKRFCERPFALHRQQAGKDKQNVDVASPAKFSAAAHGGDVLFLRRQTVTEDICNPS